MSFDDNKYLINMNNFGTLMFVTWVYKQILIQSQKQYYQKIKHAYKGTTLTQKEVSDQKFGQNKRANARNTVKILETRYSNERSQNVKTSFWSSFEGHEDRSSDERPHLKYLKSSND